MFNFGDGSVLRVLFVLEFSVRVNVVIEKPQLI